MNTVTTPRVFRPDTVQVKQWTRTIEQDESKVLIFYVGTECGMTVELVEERLRVAGMPMEHVRVFTPDPEDGEFFEEIRGHRGIGVVRGDREEDPHNTVWDMELKHLTWVFYGGSDSEIILDLDDIVQSGRDTENLFITLVEEYRTDEILEAIDFLGVEPEEVLEPLEEYPRLGEALGTLWTEIAIRDNY